ncbi:hypothetical protein EVA_13690 [gut metagenome]|uniref:Uncharacterized protein n=1 Tax=gut metagenome TaxID=749906 RepID=J9CE09_9ZZZZ
MPGLRLMAGGLAHGMVGLSITPAIATIQPRLRLIST